MKKHLYYEVLPEDKERVTDLAERYVKLVGHLPIGMERILPAAYDKDFTDKTIHNYGKAFNVMEEMLGQINIAKGESKLQFPTERKKFTELQDLYNDIRAEQNYLTSIFREFEGLNIYTD